MRLLLAMGPGINALGNFYGSVLQAVAAEGNKEIMWQLLDKGANVNAQGVWARRVHQLSL